MKLSEIVTKRLRLRVVFGCLAPTLFLFSLVTPKVLAADEGHDHSAQHNGSHSLLQESPSPQEVVIPKNSVVILDKDIDATLLRIDGTLKCPTNGKIRIQAQTILINGLFECGQENKRFAGTLDIVMKPDGNAGHMGTRAIGIHGILRLFGDIRNAGFQRINKTALAGDDVLHLEQGVQWQEGDEIVLAPTGFDANEAERLFVKSVSGNTVRLKAPLKFTHWGQDETVRVKGRAWTLSERAEVANLSRNIRIYPSGTEESHDRMGAHMMVMRGGAAYVDSVELVRMGQMGVLGRYPFHWHRVGSARGQFIVNSSIHDTYQRCITIHGTQDATVRNNVCFNHFGHGFFLEDGDEVNNKIIGNLGILSKAVPKERMLLLSDVGGGPLDRFPSPSTFWISNPANTVVGNVAAGSEGTGFWMSFARAIDCDARGPNCIDAVDDRHTTHRPINEDTLAYNSNVAHTTLVGHTWDGIEKAPHTADRTLTDAHYAPRRTPIFKNIVAYKNKFAGVYFRGNTVEFHDSIFADNQWSLFFAYNQVVKNSLIVGCSKNRQPSDFDYLAATNGRRNAQGINFYGIVMYDGPFDLSNVDFALFSTSPEKHLDYDVTSYPISVIGGASKWTNKVQKLNFAPEPLARVLMTTDHNWIDTAVANSIRDLDGSLTPEPNRLLVARHPFNLGPRCSDRPDLNAYVCDHRVGLMIFHGGISFAFSVERSDGARSVSSAEESYRLLQDPMHPYQNKWNMILGENYEYTVSFLKSFAPTILPFSFLTETRGELSPVVKLEGFGRCALRNQRRVRTLDELRGVVGNAYLVNGNDLYLRLIASEASREHTSEYGSSATSGVQNLECR